MPTPNLVDDLNSLSLGKFCARHFYPEKKLSFILHKEPKMNPQDGAKSEERPEGDQNYDSEFELLSNGDPKESFCSTSDSEMSNSFLCDAVMGQYSNWTREHNRWLGRWVNHDQMRDLLYSMQAFKFLDLQTFLATPTASQGPEIFQEGIRVLDKFLANAELDIVAADRRFPEGAYHFLDDASWTETFNGLYTALNYVQLPDMDIMKFYDLWIEAIVPAIEKNLPGRITRHKFEGDQGLAWADPEPRIAEKSNSD